MKLRLGFLASHGGSNMQAILDACCDGRLDAEPCVVISNNSNATALELAKAAGVPAIHLSSHSHPDPASLDEAILTSLEQHRVNLIVLAGYMKKLGPKTVGKYHGRVLNIHPALLPKFGGKGMYGHRVHEAVLAAGEKESGVTVHVADEEYDRGIILAQRKVPVMPDDTSQSLAARVLEVEHQLYAETIQRIAKGDVRLESFAQLVTLAHQVRAELRYRGLERGDCKLRRTGYPLSPTVSVESYEDDGIVTAEVFINLEPRYRPHKPRTQDVDHQASLDSTQMNL